MKSSRLKVLIVLFSFVLGMSKMSFGAAAEVGPDDFSRLSTEELLGWLEKKCDSLGQGTLSEKKLDFEIFLLFEEFITVIPFIVKQHDRLKIHQALGFFSGVLSMCKKLFGAIERIQTSKKLSKKSWERLCLVLFFLSKAVLSIREGQKDKPTKDEYWESLGLTYGAVKEMLSRPGAEALAKKFENLETLLKLKIREEDSSWWSSIIDSVGSYIKRGGLIGIGIDPDKAKCGLRCPKSFTSIQIRQIVLEAFCDYLAIGDPNANILKVLSLFDDIDRIAWQTDDFGRLFAKPKDRQNYIQAFIEILPLFFSQILWLNREGRISPENRCAICRWLNRLKESFRNVSELEDSEIDPDKLVRELQCTSPCPEPEPEVVVESDSDEDSDSTLELPVPGDAERPRRLKDFALSPVESWIDSEQVISRFSRDRFGESPEVIALPVTVADEGKGFFAGIKSVVGRPIRAARRRLGFDRTMTEDVVRRSKVLEADRLGQLHKRLEQLDSRYKDLMAEFRKKVLTAAA